MNDRIDLRLASERRGRRVASYQTLSGAALAVERLHEHGYGPDISVHPDDIGAIAAPELPEPDRRRRGRGLIGLSTFVVATLCLLWLGVAPVVAGPIAFVAALGAWTAAWWRHARHVRRARRADTLLRARRFDICCERRSEEADHLLATWWDPHAP